MVSACSEIAARVLAAGTVHEPYILPSGAVIDSYFDEYRITADPGLLREAAVALADLLPSDVEAVAGLELGGVPFALAVSAVTGLPLVLVRKAVKAYGTRRQVEGTSVSGRRVAMVDDVVRSGRQILTAAAALHAVGGIPTTAVAVLTRPGSASVLLADHGICLASMLPEVVQPAAVPIGVQR